MLIEFSVCEGSSGEETEAQTWRSKFKRLEQIFAATEIFRKEQ